MKRYLIYLALFLSISISLCSKSNAMDRYVSPTGTDAGSCNIPGMPCQTINFAISRSVDGDQVNVAAGLYDESVVINKRLKIVGEDSATTTITSSLGDAIYIKYSGLDTISQYILVKNFTISGARQCGVRMGKLGEVLVACVRLENLAIHDNLNASAIQDSGILIDGRWGGMMRDITIIHTTVYRNNRTGILIYGGWRVHDVPVGAVKGHHRGDNMRLLNVQVLHNNVTYNQFDVYFVYYNGNAVLQNVRIENMNGTSLAGIHFYGFVDLTVPIPRTSILDPGQIIFSNFSIKGNYRGACHFMSHYRTLSNFKYNNPSEPGKQCRLELIGRPDSVERACIATWAYADGITPPGELDLNDTELVISPDFDLSTKVRTYFASSQAERGVINASRCKFITPTYPAGLNPDVLSQAFMIEDRILHTIDGYDPTEYFYNAYGLFVKVRDSTAYVTPLSFSYDLSEAANINRALRIAQDGWKIYLQKSDSVYNASNSTDITSYRYATPVVVSKNIEFRTDGLFLNPNSQTKIHHLQMNGLGKTAVLNGDFGIMNTLHLSEGDLSVPAGREVVLHSSANSTALVRNDNSVTVTGDVRVQRHITGHPLGFAPEGYHYLAAPVQNAAVSQLSPEMNVRIYPDYYWYNPAYANAATFPNVFKYIESGDNCDNGTNSTGFEGGSDAAGMKGWRCPNDLSETLETGRGYALYVPTNAIVDLKGALNNGDINFPLSFSGGACAYKGWNLVGNPYPSPLDWEALHGANMGILNAAVYRRIPLGTFNNVTWASYVPGVGGTNDATRDIALGQGFFVQANAAGSLQFNNTMRPTTYQNPLFYRQQYYRQGLLKLRLQYDVFKDECILYFQDNATLAFDGQLDAYKMRNSKAAPNLSVNSLDGLALAIAAMPTFSQEYRQPLDIALAQNGRMAFSMPELELFDEGTDILLNDLKAGIQHDLRSAPYTFDYIQKIDDKRFELVLKTNQITGLNEKEAKAHLWQLYPNPASAQLNLHIAPSLEVQSAALRNAQGALIDSKVCKGEALFFDVIHLPKGLYLVELSTSKGILTKKVSLE